MINILNQKYPKTWHMHFSPGADESDRTHINDEFLINKKIIVTLKLDGECTGITNKDCHARSLNSKDHISRHWMKKLHGEIKHLIPDNLKLFGENVFAKHSIHYNNLESYFYAFAILDSRNYFLSWKESLEWFKKLGVIHVPILYEGIYDEKIVQNLYKSTYNNNEMEGYVIRISDEFSFDDFWKNTAKYVRKNHIKTDQHWTKNPVVPNQLRS